MNGSYRSYRPATISGSVRGQSHGLPLFDGSGTLDNVRKASRTLPLPRGWDGVAGADTHCPSGGKQ